MLIYPVCIYGFNEANTDYIIDKQCLENYINVQSYISEIDTTTSSEVFYGIECDLDPLNGQFIISKEKIEIVKDLFHKVMKYKCDNYNNNNFIIPELGFYICLNGDIDYSNYEIYNINNQNDNQSINNSDNNSDNSSQFLNEDDMNIYLQLLKEESNQLDELNDYLRRLADMDKIGIRRKIVLLEGYIHKLKNNIK